MARKPKGKIRARGLIVAIDGPSGAGKSTVSRQLADALEGMLLDTGGMYRGVAYYALETGATKATDLGRLARGLEFDVDQRTKNLLVNGVHLGEKVRNESVGRKASEISRFRSVRSVLTRCQRRLSRKWAKRFPVVVEGRDIGTIVFPKVPFKFFVTASPEIRAKRRLAQLRQEKVPGMTLKKVMRLNELRDKQDSTRKIAPLRVAEGAVVVDTSTMGISQVVHFMYDHICGRLGLTELIE